MSTWHYFAAEEAAIAEEKQQYETQYQILSTLKSAEQNRQARHLLAMEMDKLNQAHWAWQYPEPADPFYSAFRYALGAQGLSAFLEPEMTTLHKFWECYILLAQNDLMCRWVSYWLAERQVWDRTFPGVWGVKIDLFNISRNLHNSHWAKGELSPNSEASTDEDDAFEHAAVVDETQSDLSVASPEKEASDSYATYCAEVDAFERAIPVEELDATYLSEEIDSSVHRVYSDFKAFKYRLIAMLALALEPESTYAKYTRFTTELGHITYYFEQLQQQLHSFFGERNDTYGNDYREFSASRMLMLCEIFEIAMTFITDELALQAMQSGKTLPCWTVRYISDAFEKTLVRGWKESEKLIGIIREIAAGKGYYDFVDEADIAQVEAAKVQYLVIYKTRWD